MKIENKKPAERPVDVIILNWNGMRLLREFLPSVVENSDRNISRIVVADNGSGDGSVEWVMENYPEVALMRFDRNYGFAEGYNKAVAMSNAPYVVLLNSDVACTPAWDSVLLEYMETHPKVGACQPKILSYRNPGQFEYAGACGGYIDRNGYPYCRGRIFATCETDSGQYDADAVIHWASGAALMLRRQIYMDAGGLDANFFAHMEEIDLCWRVRLMGYRIVTVTETAVYHLGGGSLPVENPKKTYLNFRNNLLMLYKNLPAESRGRLLLRRRLLDTVAWAKFVITLDWRNAAAVFRAHRDYAAMKSKYGDMPAPGRNLLASDPMGKVNILIEYYLRGHRKFSAIFARDRHF